MLVAATLGSLSWLARTRRTLGVTRWRRNPVATAAAIVVIGAGLAAVFADVLVPHDPMRQNLSARLLPPGASALAGGRHWLGTDGVGRDILSRIVYGARVSLGVAAVAVLVRAVIGALFGLAAGFYRRWADALFVRVADIQLALPFLLLAVALATVTPPSVTSVIAVLGVTGWMSYGRLARAQTLSVREKDFIEAARALGVPAWKIMMRHIAPNVTGGIISLATIDVPALILAESSLSFLGIGVPLSTPSWGGMVALGRNYLTTAWWVPVLPGLAIAVVVLCISLLGDWLRDELDPILRGR